MLSFKSASNSLISANCTKYFASRLNSLLLAILFHLENDDAVCCKRSRVHSGILWIVKFSIFIWMTFNLCISTKKSCRNGNTIFPWVLCPRRKKTEKGCARKGAKYKMGEENVEWVRKSGGKIHATENTEPIIGGKRGLVSTSKMYIILIYFAFELPLLYAFHQISDFIGFYTEWKSYFQTLVRF